jgi:hypothetical protein
MTPAEDNVRPPGGAPDVTIHVNGGVPPVAAKLWEYDMPSVPVGRGDPVVIESGWATVIESTLDAVCTPLSATCTVKVVVPIAAFFGLPSILPPPDRFSPSGREEPESSLQA